MKDKMINDPVLFRQLLEESTPLFNMIFAQDIQTMDRSNLDDPKNYFVSELYNYYSSSITVLEYHSNNINLVKTSDFKELFYPLIRRLLESYFRIIFLFDDTNKTDARFESYLKYIELQYEKMLKDLTDFNYPVKGLHPATNNFAAADTWPDLRSMLSMLTNDNGDQLAFLYGVYRTLSFYSHGSAHRTTMDIVFPTAAQGVQNFPTVEIPRILQLIANHYLVLIYGFWPDIKLRHNIKTSM